MLGRRPRSAKGRPIRTDTLVAKRRHDSHDVTESTLVVNDLSVKYGNVSALSDFSVVVQPGQVCGLIGPNGAGKTTAIDAMTGFIQPSAGTVTLGGRDLSRLSPQARAKSGLVRTFQRLELFDDLTVRENVEVAVNAATRSGASKMNASEALRMAGIHDVGEHYPTVLPHGQRRLVAFARAIAGSPQILLLDEPASGLDTEETEHLAEHMRALVDRREIGVLLIDHDMALVLSVCDWLEVIDFGLGIASGTPEAVSRDRAVISAYIGED